MIPDPSLSITDGALVVNGWQSVTNKTSYARCVLDALAKEYGFDLDTPYQDLPENIRHMLMHGTDGRSVQVHYRGQRGVGVYELFLRESSKMSREDTGRQRQRAPRKSMRVL